MEGTLLGNGAHIRGQLEAVKRTVERGPNWLKFACFAACATAVAFDAVSVLTEIVKLEAFQIISSGYAAAFAFIGVALEVQGFFPSGARKWLNTWVKLLNRTWGRGLFYLVCGGLHLAVQSTFTIVIGCILIVCGITCFYVSRTASSKLDSLHSQIIQGHTQDLFYVRQVFSRMDIDNSGFLTTAELASACKELGTEFSTAELVAIFNALDEDSDGKISFSEFEKFWVGEMEIPWERVPLL